MGGTFQAMRQMASSVLTAETAPRPGSDSGRPGSRRSTALTVLVALLAALGIYAARHVLPPSTAVTMAVLALGAAAVLWRPQLALSAMMVGTEFADASLRGARLRDLVGLVLVFAVLCMAGVILRAACGLKSWRRVATPLDWPVAMITCYGVVSVLLGLLRGYEPRLVAFSAWHVLQWPVYYLVVTLAINTPKRLLVNVVFVSLLGLITLPYWLLSPLEGGGGLSRFAAPLLALLYVRRLSVPRWCLALAFGICVLDALQSSFRTLWVGTAISALWVLVLALRRNRSSRVVLATFVGGVTVVIGMALVFTVLRESSVGAGMHEALERSGGYRLAEARYGVQAFLEAPVFGKGFGYQNRQAWIAGLNQYGAGPTYHLFHLIILSAQGLVGMGLVLWMFGVCLFGPDARWVRRRFADNPWAAVSFGLQGAVVGALVSAAFSGPRLSHFEWIVLPALCLLSAGWARRELEGKLPPAPASKGAGTSDSG